MMFKILVSISKNQLKRIWLDADNSMIANNMMAVVWVGRPAKPIFKSEV